LAQDHRRNSRSPSTVTLANQAMPRPQLVSLLGRAGRSFAATTSFTAPRTGRLAYTPEDLVPRLAGLIPKAPKCEEIRKAEMQWVKMSEELIETWQKVAPAMPKYQAFLASHTAGDKFGGSFQHDVKAMTRSQAGRVMKEESQIALAEFYLDVAYRLRPGDMEKASDSKDLLRIARDCAEEDFEPWLEHAREFVADYDPKLHKQLEDTCPLYEVSDDIFWLANFEVAAPAALQHYFTALGHGSGQEFTDIAGHVPPRKVQQILSETEEGLRGDGMRHEPARRAAEIVYCQWFEASAMPVKATITELLMTNGLLVSDKQMPEERLLPSDDECCKVS